jgi:hypothetical protein
VLLQNLDLVAVRVLNEEEPRHQHAIAVELDDIAGLQPGGFEPRMFGVQIIHREGDMAIAVAEVIGLGSALVDGQLELEIRFSVAQINQREAVEVEAVGDAEPEGGLVEFNRALCRARESSNGSLWP